MATYTEHYNLIKPALNDKVNINNLNDNADIIDTALYNKVNTSDTENIITSADKCMLSDGTTSVEDAIDELNDLPANYKNRTDIYSYNTIQNCFVCPSDGYVEFKGNASTSATLYCYFGSGSGSGYGLIEARDFRAGLFVRKGFKFWLENATQGVFISLV